MKLTCPEWEFQIEFVENRINLVYIEDPICLRKNIADMLSQMNNGIGRFVLSDKNKELSFDKKVEIIINPFDVEINNKRILSKVFQELKVISNDETNYMQTQEIISQIFNYVDTLSESIDLPISYDEQFEITGLLKLVNMRIDSGFENEIEKLLDYVELMNVYCGIQLVILINVKSYFTLEELELFYREICYKKLNVLLIENEEKDCIYYEKRYIIDKDLCQIF